MGFCCASLFGTAELNKLRQFQLQKRSIYLELIPLGEGAKWRQSYGQKINSPFLLAFTEKVGERSSSYHVSLLANRYTCKEVKSSCDLLHLSLIRITLLSSVHII